jgi:anti-anti-sigma factor
MDLDDFRVLTLAGPLYAPTAARLRRRVETLIGQGDRAIVLDMTSVPELDAAGVGELARAYVATRAVGRSFAIINLSRSVRELLDRARLVGLLEADAVEWDQGVLSASVALGVSCINRTKPGLAHAHRHPVDRVSPPGDGKALERCPAKQSHFRGTDVSRRERRSSGRAVDSTGLMSRGAHG